MSYGRGGGDCADPTLSRRVEEEECITNKVRQRDRRDLVSNCCRAAKVHLRLLPRETLQQFTVDMSLLEHAPLFLNIQDHVSTNAC